MDTSTTNPEQETVPTHAALPIELLQAVLDFLSSKPYQEVAALITQIMQKHKKLKIEDKQPPLLDVDSTGDAA